MVVVFYIIILGWVHVPGFDSRHRFGWCQRSLIIWCNIILSSPDDLKSITGCVYIYFIMDSSRRYIIIIIIIRLQQYYIVEPTYLFFYSLPLPPRNSTSWQTLACARVCVCVWVRLVSPSHSIFIFFFVLFYILCKYNSAQATGLCVCAWVNRLFIYSHNVSAGIRYKIISLLGSTRAVATDSGDIFDNIRVSFNNKTVTWARRRSTTDICPLKTALRSSLSRRGGG